jgi:hypothetical protein
MELVRGYILITPQDLLSFFSISILSDEIYLIIFPHFSFSKTFIMDSIERKEKDIDVREKHVREKENYYEPNSDSGKSPHIMVFPWFCDFPS